MIHRAWWIGFAGEIGRPDTTERARLSLVSAAFTGFVGVIHRALPI